MSAHTPGPWTMREHPTEYGLYRVFGPTRRSAVAVVVESTDEHEADARLIAAAPELLDALREYMSQFGQGLDAHGLPYGPSQAEADRKARAVIAKAEGR